MKTNNGLSGTLLQALAALPGLDIPAKGRIAHHIRTGRIHRALALCAAGQLFIWQNIWVSAKPFLLDQLYLLGRVETLLKTEAEKTIIGDIA